MKVNRVEDNRRDSVKYIGDVAPYDTLGAAATALTASGDNYVCVIGPNSGAQVGGGVTVPANMGLKVLKGGNITVANGATLTINGPFDAGNYRCFTLTGTGAVNGSTLVDGINPFWLGAAGDNTTDDQVALNAAGVWARSGNCKRVVLPECAGFAATATVDFNGIDVDGHATIKTTATGPGVIIGNGGNFKISLDVTRPAKDWTVGNNGIKVYNCLSSILDLSSTYSAKAISFEDGDGQYSFYNKLFIRSTNYSDIGLSVTPTGTSPGCNENTAIGGSFGGVGVTPTCAINLDSSGVTSGHGKVDHWVFVEPCLQQQAGYGYIFNGATNTDVISARWEAANNQVAQFTNYAQNNKITIGSLTTTAALLPDFSTDSANCSGNEIVSYPTLVPSIINPYGYTFQPYDDGTYVHVPGFQFFTWDTGVVSRKLARAGITGIKDTGLSLSAANLLGLKIIFNDTYNKSIRIIGLGAEYWYVKAYDSSGNLLTSGTSPYHVQGRSIYWDGTRNYYRVYGNGQIFFSSTVAYCLIGAGNYGTCPYMIVSSRGNTRAVLSYTGPLEIPGQLYASAFPTKWALPAGTIIHNDAPSSGNPANWYSTKFTEITLAEDVDVAEADVDVSDGSTVVDGDIIGIKLDTGFYHYTTVASGGGTNTLTLTDAPTGTGKVATSGNTVRVTLGANGPNNP